MSKRIYHKFREAIQTNYRNAKNKLQRIPNSQIHQVWLGMSEIQQNEVEIKEFVPSDLNNLKEAFPNLELEDNFVKIPRSKFDVILSCHQMDNNPIYIIVPIPHFKFAPNNKFWGAIAQLDINQWHWNDETISSFKKQLKKMESKL